MVDEGCVLAGMLGMVGMISGIFGRFGVLGESSSACLLGCLARNRSSLAYLAACLGVYSARSGRIRGELRHVWGKNGGFFGMFAQIW